MPNYVIPDSCFTEIMLYLFPLYPIPLYLIPLLHVIIVSVMPGSLHPLLALFRQAERNKIINPFSWTFASHFPSMATDWPPKSRLSQGWAECRKSVWNLGAVQRTRQRPADRPTDRPGFVTNFASRATRKSSDQTIKREWGRERVQTAEAFPRRFPHPPKRPTPWGPPEEP